MIKIFNYELYRLVRDKSFIIISFGILFLNYAIFSGKSISMEEYIRKDFLTISLSTLYIALFIGKEFEDKKITYQLLAGNSRTKILLSKSVIVILIIEFQLFLFPISQMILTRRFTLWSPSENRFHISLILMGIYLTSLCILIISVVKKSAMSVGILILFYLLSMLAMNNKNIGEIAIHFFPLGIGQLIALNQIGLVRGMALILIWTAAQMIIAILLFLKVDL